MSGLMMAGTGAKVPPICVHFWAARSHHHVVSRKGKVRGVIPLGTFTLAIADVSTTQLHFSAAVAATAAGYAHHTCCDGADDATHS